ncbi:glycerol-3-phosphate dehydrogenase/oxidase [Roseibium sediminicola]|uniref:Glycerol-3-phosphate dehydrogenase/oxidase n=1 Tax=Roseibium sediminicola TaxID=2933272 RepID=A0ABT0H0X5_9HYPH|nr:glycerol-3-phosphate dehydrogenase/oxidase [Roseibium sp. CAU 1639]MCK7615329.1 glycerol-3-phosphate dehydrogenase/oxidase [Roseibium sp. CAU 1639]
MSAKRQTIWDRIARDGAFDAVVIGGGINGIGVYRDLALQGLDVLLVERNDFCSGCSAAPSRMIHGGLRYLENGEFDLVKESLRERDALLCNAPHLVHPLPTVIPITSYFSGLLNSAASFFGVSGKPANRGALPIKLGLTLYDWVTRHRRLLPKHRFDGKSATKRRWPKLTGAIRCSATYHDAWISHPERLGLELLQDAAAEAPGCAALNYACLMPEGDGYVVRDELTGQFLPVRPKIFVNATGAWLDDAIDELAGTDSHEALVSGTKGSHLILDNPELEAALGGHMVYFENSDGRVCIVFPFFGKVLAGSTDIRVTSASRVRCEPDEEVYILDSLRLVFPDLDFSAEDVVYSYSGIRPLPKSDQDFTGRISRGHFTRRLEGTVPQICMIGGKWTTFRAFAEQAADEVLAALERTRKTGTLGRPIGGGKAFPKAAAILERELVAEFGIGRDRAAHLVASYGTAARDLLTFCQSRADDVPLDGARDITAAEIAFLARREWVVSLADVVLRRTTLAIRGLLSPELIDSLAAVVAGELGWSAEETARQTAALLEDLKTYHGVSFGAPQSENISRSRICV